MPHSHTLPTRPQLQALRAFLHDRTRAAAAVTAQPPGEAPPPDGSPMADVDHTARALWMVVNMLARLVNGAIDSEVPTAEAATAWAALLVALEPWQSTPEVPADLKALVDAAFPSNRH